MPVTVAEGIVEVTADAKGVPRQIANDIEKGQVATHEAGKKIGTQVFGGIVTAWGAIGAASAIGSWVTGSVAQASDLNETMSKSENIFGKSNAAIVSFGEHAAVNLGLSKSTAIAAAASFGDMFTQIGFTSDAAASMSQQVLLAAADLGSFSNLDTADVAERITAAFRGEYDSLQAVIPNINAARVEQEAMTATGKEHADQLTAQEKAQAVLSIVQKDGSKAMGDFARTSSGAANTQKILTAELEDQQAKLGGQLLPVWQGFLGFLSNDLIPGLSSVIDWVGKNGETVLLLAGVLGAGAVAYWGITSAMAIYKAFSLASAAATGGLTVAQWALNAAMTANPVGLIVGLIVVLVGAIIWVATQTTFFQDAWQAMSDGIATAWTWVVGVIGDGVDWVVGVWDGFVGMLSDGVNAVGGFFSWLGNDIIAPIFAAIGGAFQWLVDTIITPYLNIVFTILGVFAALVAWVWEVAVSPVLNAIGGAFAWLGGVINDIIVNQINLAFGLFATVLSWLQTSVIAPVGVFIGGVFKAIGDAAMWLYNNAITPAINGIAVAFAWIRDNVIAPIGAFFAGVFKGIGDAAAWLWHNAIQPAIDGIAGAFSWVQNNVIGPIGRTINGIISGIGNTVRDVFNGIPGFFRSAFESALGVIRGPVNGIIGLINGAIRSLNGLHVTIPDWVPMVGGQTFGLHLPTIPMLARGTNNAPDTFIAGEAGPELITGARGATVRPYSATEDLLARGAGQKVTVELTQNISHPDPTIAGRQAARALTARLGI